MPSWTMLAEINESIRMLPDSASTMAIKYTHLFVFMLTASGIITLAIATLIVFFCIKYRRRSPEEVGGRLPAANWAEITWTVIPGIIALGMFIWGARLYLDESNPPADALEIHVVAKQWMWKIQHLSGRREIDELHVPVGRPIKLVMTSQDVIHSFFVPAFRVKQDVLPGRYSVEWFTPTQVGEYHLFCAEYCGMGHSHMTGIVTVMTPQDYAKWLSDVPTGTPTAADAGRKIFITQGCLTCHGQTAPSLAGLYGHNVLLNDGQIVVADDDYIRESIMNPRAKIVRGYQPLMPSFDKQLSEEQIFDLITYIKSLQNAESPGAEGAGGQAGATQAPAAAAGQAGATQSTETKP